MVLTKSETEEFVEKKEALVRKEIDHIHFIFPSLPLLSLLIIIDNKLDLDQEVQNIKNTLGELKIQLYGKFGNTINLEEDDKKEK